MSEAEQARAVDGWLALEAGRRFTCTEAPLFRLHVQRRRDDTMQITLAEHHAILDGWSVATMLAEVMTEYLAAIGTIEPVAVSSPQARFVDYVEREQRLLGDGAALGFWRARLSDHVAPALPKLAAGSPPHDPGAIVRETELPSQLTSALETIAHAAHVPFRTVLLAAHLYVVGWIGAQEDVVTGLVVNVRPETPDGERALGLFLNTVPLRVRLGGGTWLNLIERTFARERELLPYRACPLAEIQRALGGTPLFATLFNYAGAAGVDPGKGHRT